MTNIVYMANQLPSPVEPYVWQEARELRKRGARVGFCSMRRPQRPVPRELQPVSDETIYLRPLRWGGMAKALWLCVRRLGTLADLLERVALRGRESPLRRARALLHTLLGAYCAVLLAERPVDHIHVHHGYFGAWVAMVAARLLGISYSITLHGSDLLVHQAYLDTKLRHCRFCMTVSEFNRRYIYDQWPEVEPEKILVQRMGVERPSPLPASQAKHDLHGLLLLSVGRLHAVKDHAFLVRACAELKARNLPFLCLIAGEGPERPRIERLIRELDLAETVRLLGHVEPGQLSRYYATADLVALTSRSEGIPLVLMEAMAHGKLVLAPAITGIPELVVEGRTGFLYQSGSQKDFVDCVERIGRGRTALSAVQKAARRHVLEHFNRTKNLSAFADAFLLRLAEDRGVDAA